MESTKCPTMPRFTFGIRNNSGTITFRNNKEVISAEEFENLFTDYQAKFDAWYNYDGKLQSTILPDLKNVYVRLVGYTTTEQLQEIFPVTYKDLIGEYNASLSANIGNAYEYKKIA